MASVDAEFKGTQRLLEVIPAFTERVDSLEGRLNCSGGGGKSERREKREKKAEATVRGEPRQ